MGDVKEVELAACPFCELPAELERDSDHHGEWFNLGCSNHWGRAADPDARCPGGRIWYTAPPEELEAAITAWNTRPASTGKGEGWGPDREAVADQRVGYFTAASDAALAGLLETAALELTPWMLDATTEFPCLNAALPAYLNEAANRLRALPVSPFKGGGNQGSLPPFALPEADGPASEGEALARLVGDNFSPNLTFDKSSHATQAACYRVANAIRAQLPGLFAPDPLVERELRKIADALEREANNASPSGRTHPAPFLKKQAAGILSLLSAQPVTDEQTRDFKALASRFLGWPVPPSVRSDRCMSMTHAEYPHPRSGTSMMGPDEAENMLRYVLGEAQSEDEG